MDQNDAALVDRLAGWPVGKSAAGGAGGSAGMGNCCEAGGRTETSLRVAGGSPGWQVAGGI